MNRKTTIHDLRSTKEMARVLSPYVMGSHLVKGQRTFTKDDFIKTKFLFRLLFIVAFTAILSLFYIWSRVQIVETGYEINTLKERQHQLLEENRRLKVEVATLKSPERIQKIAIETLKMQPPKPEQIRMME